MLQYQDVEAIESLNDLSKFDTVLLVAQSPKNLVNDFSNVKQAWEDYEKIDAKATVNAFVLSSPIKGVQRLVVSPTGLLNRDYDDSRRFFDAGDAGIKRALQAGAKKIALVVDVPNALKGVHSFTQSDLVTLLGALYAAYTPLEKREVKGVRCCKVESLGFYAANSRRLKQLVQIASGIEAGRAVARDIGGSDPERMAPPRVAEYCQQVFDKCDNIKISIIDDQDTIEREYPCMAAVNRAARAVKRHQGRVIKLEYVGEGEIEDTVCLVGKGICYDTGGADVKAGGVMAGMHRDKCGAAGVAGFFKTLAMLKPRGIRVLGALAMIRNSIGEECYVADEIVTARSGRRCRVGNTDAEGRMAMVDLLCEMKEKIIKENITNAHVYTVATLTGHAVLAVGPYTAIMCNGKAQEYELSNGWQMSGDLLAEPVEISTIRREDYDFHRGKSEYEDTLQCNNAPSSRTPRGHQTPSAFMIMTSGLDEHGKYSKFPIAYSHVDIAGSEGPFPGVPFGVPVCALTGQYIMPRMDG